MNRPVDEAGSPLLDLITCTALSAMGWSVVVGGAYLLFRNGRLHRKGAVGRRRLDQLFWNAGADGSNRVPGP